MTANGFTLQFAIRLPDGTYASDTLNQQPLLWSTRQNAEAYLDQLRRAAATIGITEWRGVIVYQYCTPFVSDEDRSEHLIDELTAWLASQSGGQS